MLGIQLVIAHLHCLTHYSDSDLGMDIHLKMGTAATIGIRI